MQIDIIRTPAEMNSLEQEWNDLLSCCSASHVPFLRHEYLTAWWKSLGGGEWQQGELFIVTGRDEEQQLIGIAPLFITNDRTGKPVILLIGSFEISDYLDLIVRKNALPLFIENLFDLLSGDQAPIWQAIDFYNLPDYSPTLQTIKAAAARRGWSFDQQILQKAPYVPLPGDWEIYLSRLDKKQRHEIRRKIRRAEENPGGIRWYIAQDKSTLGQEIDAFLDLMAQDEEKSAFLTPIMRTQMHDISQAAFDAGWLQLAFLEVNGQKAGGYLNFDYQDHIWVYNSGLNFAFREYSPGWVLLGYLLQWANEHQRAAFDFMRGDEEYKYRFGAIDRHIVRATITR